MNRNIFLLAVCQALMLSCTSLMISSSGLVGLQIAPRQSLATLPLALMFLMIMVSLIPASLLMQKVGRKIGFLLGGGAGVFAGLTTGVGIYTENFWLFCLGSALYGTASAFVQFYRFAAVEVAEPEYKSRAISWVLAGGLVAAFMGPGIARYTQDFLSGPYFSASYLLIALLSVGVIISQLLLRFPVAGRSNAVDDRRPILRVITTPTFLVAVASAMIAYGTMNLLMVATPLEMNRLDMLFSQTASVIQWHIVGMFAPSFFTGALIDRFGVLKVMFTGACILLVCITITQFGDGYWYFLPALVCLGLGWNFLYIGGTTLLTEAYRPSEKGVVQGLNDFLVFTTVSATAFASGYLHVQLGWSLLTTVAAPVVLFAAFSIVFLHFMRAKASLSGGTAV